MSLSEPCISNRRAEQTSQCTLLKAIKSQAAPKVPYQRRLASRQLSHWRIRCVRLVTFRANCQVKHLNEANRTVVWHRLGKPPESQIEQCPLHKATSAWTNSSRTTAQRTRGALRRSISWSSALLRDQPSQALESSETTLEFRSSLTHTRLALGISVMRLEQIIRSMLRALKSQGINNKNSSSICLRKEAKVVKEKFNRILHHSKHNNKLIRIIKDKSTRLAKTSITGI